VLTDEEEEKLFETGEFGSSIVVVVVASSFKSAVLFTAFGIFASICEVNFTAFVFSPSKTNTLKKKASCKYQRIATKTSLFYGKIP